MTEVTFNAPPETLDLDVPVPLRWRIVIEPLPPTNKVGEIVLPDDVMDAQKVLGVIGKIVALGQLAFKSNTKSGLSLSDDANAKALAPGDWVMYGRHAGQKVRMRDGREFIICNDDEIVSIVGDPHQYQMYI